MAKFEFFLRLLPVVTFFVQLLLVWVVWSLRKEFMTTKACSEKRRACGSDKDTADDKAFEKIDSLKDKVNMLPSRLEFIALSDKMESLLKELGELSGRLGVINRAVDLLNQHHLKGDS